MDLPLFPDTMSPYFTGLVIDETPSLLKASFRLRYQVYCLERRFLPADDYPEGIETDAFEAQSIHLGVVNMRGELAATARLVQAGATGLPMAAHCPLFPGETYPYTRSRCIVEISRLAVSRDYNRRAGDGFYSLQCAADDKYPLARRGGGEIILALYKAIYQVSKRRGFTHWVSASERSLRRLVARYGFVSKAIGPESDYYGLVSPSMVKVREIDAMIVSGQLRTQREFLNGLEPELWPSALLLHC